MNILINCDIVGMTIDYVSEICNFFISFMQIYITFQ